MKNLFITCAFVFLFSQAQSKEVILKEYGFEYTSYERADFDNFQDFLKYKIEQSKNLSPGFNGIESMEGAYMFYYFEGKSKAYSEMLIN